MRIFECYANSILFQFNNTYISAAKPVINV